MTYENIQVKRHIYERLPRPEEQMIVLLTGARQTGKTTSVQYYYPDLAYYNLDAFELREQLDQVSSVGWGKTVGHAILDEIQKAPLLLEKVKYAFDAGEINFTVLTGSAQLMLMKAVRETLAGRIFLYELWPLMFSELLSVGNRPLVKPLLDRLLHSTLDNVLIEEPEILLGEEYQARQNTEEHLLTWGGMPALLRYQKARRFEWLKSYEIAYMERDLGDLARLRDLKPFRKFQQLTALRCGQLFYYSEVARDTGISVDTVRRYLEYLRLSYQTVLLPPFSENLTSRLIKTPKVYWMDIGLWRSMTGLRDTVTGQCFETFVVTEIVKYIKTAGLDVRFSFYRTRSGMEVDLILERGSLVWGFEIKSRDRVVPGDAKNLRQLAGVLGNRWQGGIVIYRGSRIQQLDNGLWAIPSWRLFS